VISFLLLSSFATSGPERILTPPTRAKGATPTPQKPSQALAAISPAHLVPWTSSANIGVGKGRVDLHARRNSFLAPHRCHHPLPHWERPVFLGSKASRSLGLISFRGSPLSQGDPLTIIFILFYFIIISLFHFCFIYLFTGKNPVASARLASWHLHCRQ